MSKVCESRLSRESLTSALYDLVGRAFETEAVDASEDSRHYLLNLLSAYATVGPERLAHALGPQYLEASSLEPASRYVRLKEVADTSLFLSGVFLDYVEAQLPATEYYFDLGSSAYLHLGSLDERRAAAGSTSDTFFELGRRFEDFARVLSAVSDADLFPSEQRTLGLYTRWMNEGTERDARRLIALGVIPVRDDNGEVH